LICLHPILISFVFFLLLDFRSLLICVSGCIGELSGDGDASRGRYGVLPDGFFVLLNAWFVFL
jgi:hypothetical protein